MKYHALGAVMAIGLLGLSGCSGAQSDAPNEDQPVPDTHPKATYGSVLELREAFEVAGGKCPNFKQNNEVNLAAESATCSPTSVLSTYLSQSAVQNRVQQSKEEFMGLSDEEWLVGENWIISDEDVRDLQRSLGGQIVTFTPIDPSQVDEASRTFAEGLSYMSRRLSKDEFKEAFELGQSYCNMLDNGVGPATVMEAAASDESTSFTKSERGVILAAGVVGFCEEYMDDFD